MPHPERDAWTFMHRDGDAATAAARGNARAMLAPSGGIRFFEAFAAGLAVSRPAMSDRSSGRTSCR